MSRILIVDDEPDLLALVKTTLEVQNHVVTTSQNGSEAIARLKKERYDLMIIDRNMPGINGVDVIAMARANHAWKDLKIVMLTSESLIKAVDEAFLAGADDYIVKPIKITGFLEKISAILASPRKQP